MSASSGTVTAIATKSILERRVKRSSQDVHAFSREPPASGLERPSRWWRSPKITGALVFWALIYVLFTIRSLGLGRPFIIEQALLRLPMMAVGILLTGAIYGIVRRVIEFRRLAQLCIISAAIVGAAIAYACTNYLVFYVLPDTWTTPQGPLGKIEEYIVGMIPIFTLCSIGIAFFETKRRTAIKRSYEMELWANVRGGKVRIAVADIQRIHAERDYVRVQAPQGSYLVRSTMRQMEQQLDPAQFVRVHRSVILPRSSISSVEKLSDGRLAIRLDKDTVIPIGRNFVKRIMGKPDGSEARSRRTFS